MSVRIARRMAQLPISGRRMQCLFSTARNAESGKTVEDPLIPYNRWMYRKIIDEYNMVLFCQYNNMKISQFNALKSGLLAQGIESKFIVSRHFRDIIDPDSPNNPLLNFFVGPVMAFYTNRAPEQMADFLNQVKRNRSLLLLGGIFEGKIFSHEVLCEIAEQIKSTSFSNSQLISCIEGTPRELANCIENAPWQLVNLLSMRKE